MAKYTQGEEYLLNGSPYIGPYCIVENNINYAYTGESYIFGISKKLTPIIKLIDKLDVGIYSKLNEAYYNKETWAPNYIYPIITEEDIKNKYLFRYFGQKSNSQNNPIIEISKDDYNKSILYRFVKLKWYIIGSDSTIIELNTDSINEGSKIINNLKFLLKNPLELKKNYILN